MTRSEIDLAALARRRGMKLGAVVDRTVWLRPFVVDGLPIVVFNSRALEFPHDPPGNVHYVGPMVGDRREPVDVPRSEERR